jgi:hypothetical protein
MPHNLLEIEIPTFATEKLKCYHIEVRKPYNNIISVFICIETYTSDAFNTSGF